MRIFFQYNISWLFIATYLIALCFSKNLGSVTAFMLLQPVLIWLVVTLLYEFLPKGIRKTSHDNCFRVDGSQSVSRESREKRAVRKVHLDLYWVFIVVSFSGIWLLLAFDSLVPKSITNELFAVLMCVVITWVVAVCVFVVRFYLKILREFSEGIKNRSKQYIDIDLARIQNEFQTPKIESAINEAQRNE